MLLIKKPAKKTPKVKQTPMKLAEKRLKVGKLNLMAKISSRMLECSASKKKSGSNSLIWAVGGICMAVVFRETCST